MDSGETKKKKRKTPYVPHVAAARFKPTEDWLSDEAHNVFEKAKFPLDVDTTHYEDCISGMAQMPDECVDVVVADPPFGIAFNGKESIYNRNSDLVVEGYHEIEGDYDDFTFAWISRLSRILKQSGSAWIFSGWTNLRDVLNAVEQSGLNLVNHVIWKYQFGVFTRRKFVSSHYHLIFLVKNPKKYYFNKIQHYPLDVWDIKRTYLKGQIKNGTKLPENLVMRCIDFSSRPGDLIFDPFMGNGTTAVTAKGSFRHYLGFEINPNMRKIIDTNLGLIELGEFYIPYSERKDPLVEKAREKYGKSRNDIQESTEAQTSIDSWIESN